jgi:spoIIIJ-associated protein
MNAYERKIVHDALGPMSGIETVSEGEDPDRRVVIRRTRSAPRSRS